jgi:hypothetical protein
MVERDGPYGNVTRRMRFSCRITTERIETRIRYVLIAFPRHDWLRERVIIHFARTVTYLPDYMISRTGRPQCGCSFSEVQIQ